MVLAECKWFCKVHSSNLQNKSRHSKVHLHIPGKYLQSVALHSYESLHKPKKIDILVANQRWDRFFLKKNYEPLTRAPHAMDKSIKSRSNKLQISL